MVKRNQRFNQQTSKRKPSKPNNRPKAGKPFKSGKPKPKSKGQWKHKKNTVSAEQLDKELEQYWGGEVAHKHLDLDMDDYWNKKPK